MKKTIILLGLMAVVLAPPIVAGDGAASQPMSVTAVNPSSLINGNLMADYPTLPGPVVPPLPAPEDPEYRAHSSGASGHSALLGGSPGTPALHGPIGGGAVLSGPRSSNLTVDPRSKARRSLRKLIRDLG